MVAQALSLGGGKSVFETYEIMQLRIDNNYMIV